MTATVLTNLLDMDDELVSFVTDYDVAVLNIENVISLCSHIDCLQRLTNQLGYIGHVILLSTLRCLLCQHSANNLLEPSQNCAATTIVKDAGTIFHVSASI